MCSYLTFNYQLCSLLRYLLEVFERYRRSMLIIKYIIDRTYNLSIELR